MTSENGQVPGARWSVSLTFLHPAQRCRVALQQQNSYERFCDVFAFLFCFPLFVFSALSNRPSLPLSPYSLKKKINRFLVQ